MSGDSSKNATEDQIKQYHAADYLENVLSRRGDRRVVEENIVFRAMPAIAQALQDLGFAVELQHFPGVRSGRFAYSYKPGTAKDVFIISFAEFSQKISECLGYKDIIPADRLRDAPYAHIGKQSGQGLS